MIQKNKKALKTSLCITVLNEEKSIGKLLDSIFAGTKKPNEVVIIDGGSKDKTVEIIRHYQKKHSNIKLLVEKGGIAHGRNTAIEIAKGEIIVQIDAGCIAKRDWFEKITNLFHIGGERGTNWNFSRLATSEVKGVNIVAGFYEMPVNSPHQAAMSVFHGIPPERFDPKTFIPSARSCAFRKSVWEKLGGYNEKLKKTGEDTLFFYNAVKNNFRIERVGEARVIWEEISSLSLTDFFWKTYNYARGDAKSKIWIYPSNLITSHNIKILFIFLRYMVGMVMMVGSFIYPTSPLPVLLLILFILYLFWPIYKWFDVVKTWQGRLWLPVVQILSDFAVMSGFLRGICY